MIVQEVLDQATKSISRRDAETLLQHYLRRERAWVLAHPEALLDGAEIPGYFRLVSRRAKHCPLQYLTMRQEFYGLDLQLSLDVLIPRPETELLVEAVLAWTRQQAQAAGAWRVVDVGTGSGAIALALANELPGAMVWALDISAPVRPVVELNANRLGLERRVRFVESDLLGAFTEPAGFDVVVSNPPYVPRGDAEAMQPEVRDFEPRLALFAGEDGLAVYRRLIPQAREALRPGGLLAMEFGFGQRDALASLLQGWDAVTFQEDYAGIPRIVTAERP